MKALTSFHFMLTFQLCSFLCRKLKQRSQSSSIVITTHISVPPSRIEYIQSNKSQNRTKWWICYMGIRFNLDIFSIALNRIIGIDYVMELAVDTVRLAFYHIIPHCSFVCLEVFSSRWPTVHLFVASFLLDLVGRQQFCRVG